MPEEYLRALTWHAKTVAFSRSGNQTLGFPPDCGSILAIAEYILIILFILSSTSKYVAKLDAISYV